MLSSALRRLITSFQDVPLFIALILHTVLTLPVYLAFLLVAALSYLVSLFGGLLSGVVGLAAGMNASELLPFLRSKRKAAEPPRRNRREAIPYGPSSNYRPDSLHH